MGMNEKATATGQGAKCGQCLMEAVEVVTLRADGSCPRCEGNYSRDIAPRLESEIRTYVLHFSGKVRGEAGESHAYTARRSAVTAQGAWEQLYDTYEQINRGKAEKVDGRG